MIIGMHATTQISELRLEIAVCTYGADGIRRLAKSHLPEVEGVAYVVSWQCSDGCEVPEALSSRADVAVFRSEGKGLSRNRNSALALCSAPLVLIADDDVDYDAEGLARALDTTEAHPEHGIFTFMVTRPDQPCYPAEPTVLGRHKPKGYWVSSVEIMLRPAKTGDLRFDTRFGLGSGEFGCGEEELFVLTAQRRGVGAMFIPIVIGHHDNRSTGSKATPGILRAHGCLIALEYGMPSCAPRLVLKGWRVWRAGNAPLFKALNYIFAGAWQSRLISAK